MECQFCGKDLDKGDLGASTCQGCGDVFDQTQISELRDHLNIEAYRPPEITPQVNKDDPISLPDSEQCPDCFADLMSNDLDAWTKGSPCPYCGAKSSHSVSSEVTGRTTNQVSDENNEQHWVFTVNSGPSIGQEISLAIGSEIGRKAIRALLPDSGYNHLLSTISSEHVRFHDLADGKVGVEDLGSLNGTYLNGDRVVGPVPKEIMFGDVLSIHNLCLTLTPKTLPFVNILHIESGVSWNLPLSPVLQQIHFGRLTADGRRSPWYRMAQLQLQGDHAKLALLDSISRRHLHAELVPKQDGFEIQIWHEQGKEPCDIQIGTPTNGTEIHQESTILPDASRRLLPIDTKILLKMPKNTFSLKIRAE